MAKRYGVARVSHLMALDFQKLNTMVGPRSTVKAGANSGRSPSAEFVEIASPPWTQAAACTIRLEKSGRGAMTVDLPGRSNADLIQVARGLWGED